MNATVPTAMLTIGLLCGCTSRDCPPTRPGTPGWSNAAAARGTPLTPGSGWIFRTARRPARATLICIHGISTHAAWFQPLAAELNRRGYDLVCPNRPRSGELPRVTDAADFQNGDDFVEALDPAFAQAKRSGGPVYLVGTSWGAKVALAAAAQRRAQINGVILIVPVFRAQKEAGLLGGLVALGRWITPGCALPSPSPRDYLRASDPAAHGDGAASELLAEIERDARMLCRATQRFHREGARLQRAGLAEAKDEPTPMLALFADEDQIADREFGRATAFAVGAKTVAILRGEGHAVQVENPVPLARAIGEWIATGTLRAGPGREIVPTPR